MPGRHVRQSAAPHGVEDVTIENLRYNGRLVQSDD